MVANHIVLSQIAECHSRVDLLLSSQPLPQGGDVDVVDGSVPPESLLDLFPQISVSTDGPLAMAAASDRLRCLGAL
jgi:hypothetical protein